jgi:phenylalanyl-tRNA synthetase beta chain
MLPNMLDTLLMNMRLEPEAAIRIFELGKIFVTRTEQEVEQQRAEIERERVQYPRLRGWKPAEGEERLPLELNRLTGLMAGPRQPRSLFSQDGGEASQPWNGDELDFFDAKGVVEEMLRHLHLAGVEWVPADAPLFHPGRVAMLRSGGRNLGIVGELHPALLAEWNIPARRVAAWDLDVEALVESVPERHLYNQVSPYVPVRQDMAFVVPADMPAALLAGAIKRAGGASVLDVTLFDIYTGPQVGEGQKSMAFAVTFNSTEKLLTEEDVARVRQRIARTLERELGAKLRG